jgi:hypothetical protein
MQSMKSGTSATGQEERRRRGREERLTEEELHHSERLTRLCVHRRVVSQSVDRHAKELLQGDDPLLDDVGSRAQRHQPLLRERNILRV